MEFDSYLYLAAFLPLVWGGYHGLRRQTWLILCASYVFYGWHQPLLLIPLGFSSVWDFLLGRRIHRTASPRGKRFYLVLSLLLNLGLLCSLKYGSWLASVWNDTAPGVIDALPTGSFLLTHRLKLAVMAFRFPEFILPLPPGISFYTFQTLSYTIDIYRGESKPHPSFVDYLAFVSFFPQLIAGPIERARNLLPQIAKRPRSPGADVYASAIFLIAWGLFKKLVIADNLGDVLDTVELEAAGAGIVVAYAFAFQIYCDFSAYTDIARGSARLFGIELSRNFLTPYWAVSPSDFWARWHISLSTWLRDYLYIPLGGNRYGIPSTLRNLVLTMGLGGLWHGAGWHFVVWGLYHGVLLVFYRVLPLDEILTRTLRRAGSWIAILIMFHLTCVGWILFRAESMSDALLLFQSVGVAYGEGVSPDVWQLLRITMILAMPIILTDALATKFHVEFTDMFSRFPALVQAFLYVIIFYGIVLLGKRQGSEFIYFQF